MVREVYIINCEFLLVDMNNFDLIIFDFDFFIGMLICKGRVTGKVRVVKILEEVNFI